MPTNGESMQIKISFDVTDIYIRLFNRSAVVRWFNYFKHVNPSYRQISYRDLDKEHAKTTEQDWQIILDSVNVLKSQGFKFETQLPKQYDSNQPLLNELHRFFTSNLISNPTHEKYLKDINSAVHRLEFNTYTFNRNYVKTTFTVNMLEYVPFPSVYWLEFDQEEQNENYRFECYNEENLVILNKSILGKSILNSFLDEDDPTEFDCTGIKGSRGGFTIDLNNDRRKLYNGPIFKDWCKKYGLSDHLPLEFPIGYVENSKCLNLIKNATYIKVDFL